MGEMGLLRKQFSVIIPELGAGLLLPIVERFFVFFRNDERRMLPNCQLPSNIEVGTPAEERRIVKIEKEYR